MKNQDNITQLYQDAFNDFEVQAPVDVYAKVQSQLGRKSLLTLDPTRLNVFYLALMSGIVAWALLGNSDTITTTDYTQRTEPVIEAVQFIAEDYSGTVNEASAPEIAEQVFEKALIVTSKSETKEKVQIPRIEKKPQTEALNADEIKESIQNQSKDQHASLVSLEEEAKDDRVAPSSSTKVVDEQEVVKLKESKRKTPAQSVQGASLESPSDLLDMLKHDRDGNASLKVKSK